MVVITALPQNKTHKRQRRETPVSVDMCLAPFGGAHFDNKKAIAKKRAVSCEL